MVFDTFLNTLSLWFFTTQLGNGKLKCKNPSSYQVVVSYPVGIHTHKLTVGAPQTLTVTPPYASFSTEEYCFISVEGKALT